jgi:hypothetical protein
MPLIGVVVSMATIVPLRWYDTGCCGCKRKLPALTEEELKLLPKDKIKEKQDFIANNLGTTKTDVFDYVDLHAGPQFLLYAKYSSVLLIIAVTFTFGFMAPILFPICAFGLFNIYVMDTLMLTYWFRRPPMYDDMLYKKALDIIKYFPLPMFALGYWCMSNGQMFKNVKLTRSYINSGGNPHHPLIDYTSLNQGHMGIAICAFWVVRFIYAVFPDFCKCQG